MENVTEQSKPPLAVEAEKFVVEGLRFIKKGEFGKAMLFFRNPQKARRLGLSFEEESRIKVIDGIMTKEKEAEALKFCIQNSEYKNGDSKIGKPSLIRIARLYTRDLGGRLPKTLWHELALISAEEWTHALQDIRGEPLAGEKDNELDVLAYFAQQGIPLTKSFLARHERKDSLVKTV
ncbi:MAG TPA: hypothetical protein VFD45_02635 [Patescibacteria group bacterium]|nr:hypothetical protein [Patescibacteria group bacterium]